MTELSPMAIGYAGLRWAQSACNGFAPNARSVEHCRPGPLLFFGGFVR